MHQASSLELKFVCRELSGTICGPGFNFLVLSEHYYFFLSGGINKHITDYELGAETDVHVGREEDSGKTDLGISHLE